MKPFVLSEAATGLSEDHPSADNLRTTLPALRMCELESFLRLWVSEGIPYAFRDVPMLYESVRKWLGGELGIHPKLITLIGSGRIGFSLAPNPEFGRRFSSASDLDFAIIDEPLFLRLAGEFLRWRDGFLTGRFNPRGPLQTRNWESNADRGPKNIQRGFIDVRKIPTFREYPTAVRVVDALSRLKRKTDLTERAPKVRWMSGRAYRNWGAFVAQMFLNLGTAVASLRSSHFAPGV